MSKTKRPTAPSLFDLEDLPADSGPDRQDVRPNNKSRRNAENSAPVDRAPETSHIEIAAQAKKLPAAQGEQFAHRYGVSVPTIWRSAAAGTLPKPKKLFNKTSRWSLADLLEHEKNLRSQA
jgi:predicted DNA-binding transcriptional regulator AlpA